MVFCKKNFLENLAKFTGKHLCQSFFFNKVACLKLYMTGAVVRKCSVKKLFLKISQNSQENTCARVSSFLIKLQSSAYNFYLFIYFFYLGFLSRISVVHRTVVAISLAPLYHFHPLHRHSDISRATAAESSLLHKGSSRTRIGIFVFRAQIANH